MGVTALYPSIDGKGELENVRHHGGDNTLKRGEYQKIRYQLYEKPMLSRLVTMEKSSLPIKTKITVLAQEIVRWKRNTHREEEKEESDRRMTKFMVKLRASGYSRGQHWEILKSGTRKFNRMVEEEIKGEEGIKGEEDKGNKKQKVMDREEKRTKGKRGLINNIS